MIEIVAERPMRAKEIADRLGLKWTTAYRTVTHLLEHDYLRRDEDTGTYSIGPRLYYRAQAYLTHHPLLMAGSQVLRALAAETGGTAQLNERTGLLASTLLNLDARFEMIPKTTSAFHFPLHTGSKGQVLLAFSEPSVLEELLAAPLAALTPHSIVDSEQLRRRVAEIHRLGHAVTRQDVQLGTGSVAAPIFQADGTLAGAICVIVHAEEMDEDRVATLVGAVTRAAREASLNLGWRHGGPPPVLERWVADRPG